MSADPTARGKPPTADDDQKSPETVSPEPSSNEGQPLAEITISLNGEPVATESLRALNDNPDGSFWQRTRDSVSLMLE